MIFLGGAFVKFVKVAEITEIAAGEKKKVILDGKEILLANVEGTYYAISDKCPHMGGSLSEGILEDYIITCPRHGSKFDVRTGKEVHGAKILFLNINVKDDRSYPVKVEGTDILIGAE
jgi:3-phenylpropionate/trans-cinnamate dioxygenase ferredoxin component